jgi:hypothetical protein
MLQSYKGNVIDVHVLIPSGKLPESSFMREALLSEYRKY